MENWKAVLKWIGLSNKNLRNTAKDRVLYSQDRHMVLGRLPARQKVKAEVQRQCLAGCDAPFSSAVCSTWHGEAVATYPVKRASCGPTLGNFLMDKSESLRAFLCQARSFCSIVKAGAKESCASRSKK